MDLDTWVPITVATARRGRKDYGTRLPGVGDASSLEPRFPSSTLLPFFSLGVSLLKPSIRKKGTLIIKGLLGNLVVVGGP